MIQFNKVRPGSTLYIPFESFAGQTGAPITMTGFATSDIKVYKDGSTTERASASGFTLLDTDGTDFDGITGIHGFSIDLSDNTTADFWACGSRYIVVVSTITVDGQTMSFLAAIFEIGYETSTLCTTIASLSSQTSFTLTTGPAEDSALNGSIVLIHDQANAVQRSYGVITAYTGSTKTVTLAAAPTFTIAAKDNISVFLPALLPTVAGRTLDVSSGGEAGLDWANIGSPTTTVGLSGTTIATTQKVDIETIKTQSVTLAGGVTIPAATLASTTNITAGTITTATNVTTVNGLAAGVITASSIAADAITDAKVASDVTIASVTGAVGSVTAGVTVTTNNDKTGYGLSAAAVQAIWDAATSALITVGSIGKYLLDHLVGTLASGTHNPQSGDAYARLGAPAGASVSADVASIKTDTGTTIPGRLPAALVGGRMDSNLQAAANNVITAAVIADGAIDRATYAADTGHQAIRSNTAQAGSSTSITLDAASSAVTDFYKNTLIVLTGGTGVGQSRFISAYNGTTKVATVMTWATTPDNTTTFAIMPGDSIPGATSLDAAGVRAAIGLASANLDTQLTAIDDYIDTEVSAIKAKTDQLTFTTANRVDSTTQSGVSTLDASGAQAAAAAALSGYGAATGTQVSTCTTTVTTAISALNNLSAAQVNAEVVDALATDTYAEPGQGNPAATTSLVAKLGYLYKAWRNKATQDATTHRLYADDAVTVDQKSAVSDDGTTFTRGEIGTGP